MLNKTAFSVNRCFNMLNVTINTYQPEPEAFVIYRYIGYPAIPTSSPTKSR